jgi:quinol monooxygenase YgiN
MQMFADGARSADIVQWIAKAEAKAEAVEIEEWKVQEAFAVFWQAYPHKTGKPDALKAFRGILKRFTLEQIMVGVGRYVHIRRPDQPWLNPATFLRQERFADQPAHVSQRLTNSVDAARQKLREEIVDEQHRSQGQDGNSPQPVRRLSSFDF